MSRPTVDQASTQNIGDSEFGNLVVRWREQDNSLHMSVVGVSCCTQGAHSIN